MFSNRIANSAKFLQMPLESQLLYFHFVLRADDDGVVESYPIIRLLGVSSDSFKVLVAKSFITLLNEDQVVVIPDWLEHNKIRSDRKVNSIYLDLIPEGIEVLKPKPRSDVKDNSNRVSGQSTVGIGKDSIGKDSIGKYTYGELEKVLLTKDEHSKLLDRFGKKNTEVLIFELDTYIASKGVKYKSHYATLLNWAKRKWDEQEQKKITSESKVAFS